MFFFNRKLRAALHQLAFTERSGRLLSHLIINVGGAYVSKGVAYIQ